jgi:hypothetical protein
VSKRVREVISDWLMLVGAPILFGSLFLTWSHQFSPAFLAQYGNTQALAGVPRDPTAWQVYSIVDLLLAALAAGLLAAALRGWRGLRVAVLLGLLVAIVFTIHALGTPPTNGANLFDPSLNAYSPNHPTAAAGEVVALVGMGIGLAGVLLSFTV